MSNKSTLVQLVGITQGTSAYKLPKSSSIKSAITEANAKEESPSTTNNQKTSKSLQDSYHPSNFMVINPPTSFGANILDCIARSESEIRAEKITQYINQISLLIYQDEYIDGEISESERYIVDAYQSGNLDYLADALMHIYSSNFGNAKILEGILTMISSVPYEAIYPNGQVMAMGLLSHKTLLVRDKAIQCFEKWNSKKGLEYLKNIECSPSWLQKYVDKVIMYIERDGEE